MTDKDQIILYQSDDSFQLEVKLKNETVWLNRQQIATLFDRDVKTIGKHVNNALTEELKGLPVVAKFATTAADGKTYQVEHYNLDIIISVGYRVKSIRGTQFRIWANNILKEYLLRGYAANQRFERIEKRLEDHDQKFDLLIKTSLPPTHGIFFDGQIYDAYNFVAKIIRSAKKSIVLIDNYIDETVLTLFTKRAKNVSVKIYTSKISSQLQLDITRLNAQYQPVEVKLFSKSHDRFLIIDEETVYHIGASLKDLGKKWFAFSKMSLDAIEILNRL